jgi:diguanylate cyclase (GGDEF)-like protein
MSASPHSYRVLTESPLFAGMSELEFNAVTAFLERRLFRKGDFIFKEGDRGEEMFIVLSGSIDATVSQTDGTQRRLYAFGPGRFFGEMAVIENAPRSATCRAAEDSNLLVLQGIDFYRLVFEHPMIALKFLTAIGSTMTSWLDESSRFLNDLVRWGETARRRAVTDELTGLYNRRFLEEALAARFSQGSVGRRKMTLLMLDLDRIHEVNNAYGSAAGDAVIIAAGNSFLSVLREGDIAARLSGDEFAFLLPDTDGKEGLRIAERLRAVIAELRIPVPAGSAEASVMIKASLGVGVAPDQAGDPQNLMAVADAALRRAKDSGRDRVVCA